VGPRLINVVSLFDAQVAALELLDDPTLARASDDLRGPVDPDAIRRFEADSGLALPPAVREWLGHHNGGLIGNQIVCGLGTGASWEIEATLRMEPRWMERGWIPVGADGNGDYYLSASATSREPEGLVFFVDQMDFGAPAYAVGSDMWHFLYGLASQELRSEEWWPFERDRALEVDPMLARVASVPLPWDEEGNPR
jgi:cell wall assembly regulator SMI1